MSGAVIFDPLLPWPVLWGVAALAVGVTGLALWRGLSGWALRGLAAAVLLAALANPALQSEQRTPLSDIVVVVVDESASQRLSDRADQTAAALARIEAQVAALPNTELRVVRLGDGADNAGTELMTALAQALAEQPRARLAGAILLTDGQLHDIERAPDVPAPLHALLTGHDRDWDRRLIVKNAPAFGILGEELVLTLRIEDQGAVPPGLGGETELTITVDGGAPRVFEVPVDVDLELPVTLSHGGMNVIQFELAAAEGELTDRNNAAVVQINGVRDRLRVLLVSGEPHPGERTWRNLLKSDSAVDLVHFTILRPPEKQDGVPVTELSLIAFPTRELFLEKIEEFDLIVFDRYKRRGILPMLYLDNVRSYVENGGAMLIAAGPDFASADSLYRSPLSEILPAEPTARVLEEGFRPEITDLGQRHPVTEGLREEAGGDWGRWFRLVELEAQGGQVVMQGPGDRPLLVLDRVGEGRVALLASDHAWLWDRGFEGGGPQLELLRRLAHWMMKEPELEEEALRAEAEGQTITVTRRSLEDAPREVEITAPDGSVSVLPLEEVSPGRFVGRHEGGEIGLYRLREGEREAVVALGPSAPREFEETIASGAALAPVVAATRGGVLALEDGAVRLRQVREGRVAAGRGWIGLTPRGAYVTADITITPLAPAWLFLLLAAGLSLGGWLREGRR
ncbi:glutamine amidotransferase [Actibacterium sp. MT2.3-13A]|uniref:glutamine amidotransferase n=1 Tax=Actibacterium sp. MT2.3-13A TaxID=2828332 RepID=UPI001BA5AC12|nr:glutamine amidotransferase [Actibacterium sp. MT2.3-13A]